LAGAQPKTALLLEQHRWGVPSGRIPTTHILKPPTGHFDGHAENEHICLMVARALGLPAASSQVMKFEKEIAIIVERYDRQRSGNDILRVHQEDVCQALAVMPTKKYQNEGGPSVRDVVELLNAQSSEREEDIGTFLGAIGFNWLIAGTDAHAKNYSLLITGGPRVRLAPLYDIASILPYEEVDLHKVKLALKIGGEYELSKIGLRQWQKLAREIRADIGAVIDWLNVAADELPDAVTQASERARKDGLQNAIIDRLAAGLINRAKACKRLLAAAA
jgi:serine/threonine-protein kinase HipA